MEGLVGGGESGKGKMVGGTTLGDCDSYGLWEEEEEERA
jgi:hypothetical protein